MPERPRILVFEAPALPAEDLLAQCPPDCDLVRVQDVEQGLARLRNEHFDGIVASNHHTAFWQRTQSLLRADHILNVLCDGIVLATGDLRITWANATLEKWAGESLHGRGFYEGLGSPEILGPDYSPFHNAMSGKTVETRLHCRDNRYVDLHVTPLTDPHTGQVLQLLGLLRDVTPLVQQQQKLDAIHKAGRELASLAPDQLADMEVDERIEMLKSNIRRFTHDLLNYDVVEIRLLDRCTSKLEPLLDEGMTPEASHRELYARAEGNGVTGFVAATGKSYLCADTANDPLYLEGAKAARSSLTVPLLIGDKVIGTFNVESPRLDGFGEQDLQFAEIFGREIAAALHTLELLTAEQRTTTTRSVDAISREVALPVDDILAATTAVLDRWIGHEPEMADKLRTILAAARSIKQCIQKVGQNLPVVGVLAAGDADPHPELRGMRILVADNDERVRRSAHSLLGRLGCIVETARDGKEALTMGRLCTYDAILADIRLPDMSGYEVYRELRLAQPQARVILMTGFGYDPSHSLVKARQDGLRFVLYKPFQVDKLLDALESSDAPVPPPAPTPNPELQPEVAQT